MSCLVIFNSLPISAGLRIVMYAYSDVYCSHICVCVCVDVNATGEVVKKDGLVCMRKHIISENVTAEEASAIEAGESEAIHDNAWLMFAEKPLLAIIYCIYL